MVDKEALDKIDKLIKVYEYNWGKQPDLNITIRGMSSERLTTVLERIVETGESVLVGYGKLFLEK